MGDVDEKIVAVSASGTVASAIANASVNATGAIPSDKLNDILMNAEYMKTLQRLIAKAVKEASSITSLRDAITKLFQEEAKKNTNTELSKALTALQNALQLIYKSKDKSEGGARKRKSKRRNYYKKRRTSKYR
jgi:DNA-binding protein YbaB